VIIPLNTDN